MTAAFCSISSPERHRYLVLLSQLEGPLGYLHISLPLMALKVQHLGGLKVTQVGQGEASITSELGQVRNLFTRRSRSGVYAAYPQAPGWMRRVADALSLEDALEATLRGLGLLRIAVLDSSRTESDQEGS